MASPRPGLITIAVPDGVEPGQALLVTGPDGEEIEVIVPEGVGAGDSFEVDVGAPPPSEDEAADGQLMDVEVPDGVAPGQTLLVTGPAGASRGGWGGLDDGFHQRIPRAAIAALAGPLGEGRAAFGAAIHALGLGHGKLRVGKGVSHDNG